MRACRTACALRPLAQRAHRRRRRQAGERLEQIGDLGAGEPEVAVAAVALDGQQAALDELGQGARWWSRRPRRPRRPAPSPAARGRRRAPSAPGRGPDRRPARRRARYRHHHACPQRSAGIIRFPTKRFGATLGHMRRHLPLLAICLGYFMVILDATIVNVALPSIGRDLGGGVGGLQWVVDAYTVVFAGLLLSAGSIGDLIGSRKVLDTGLGAVHGRVGGLRAGAVGGGAGRRARRPGARRRADGPQLAGAAAARLPGHRRAGPGGRRLGRGGRGRAPPPARSSAGCWCRSPSWRAVFLVNLPVGLLAHVAELSPPAQGRRALGRRARSSRSGARRAHADAAHARPDRGRLVGLGVAAGADRTARVRPGAGRVRRRRARRPQPDAAAAAVLEPHVLGRHASSAWRSTSGSTVSCSRSACTSSSVRGFSALETGLALLPEGVFVALSSVLSGRLTGRTGPRVPMLVGLLLGAAGFAGADRRRRIDPVHAAGPRPDRGGLRDGVHDARGHRGDDRGRAGRARRDRLGRAQRRPPGRRRDRRRTAGHAAGRQPFVSGLHLAMAASAASFLPARWSRRSSSSGWPAGRPRPARRDRRC